MIHLVSDTTQDNSFQAAISQSGVISTFQEIDWPTAKSNGEKLKTATNCDNVACLQSLDAATLFSSAANLIFMATIDGSFLKTSVSNSLYSGNFKKVPVVIGSTKSEFSTVFCNDRYRDNMTYAEIVDVLAQTFGSRQANLAMHYYNFANYPTSRIALVDIFADAIVHCPTRRAALQLSAHTNTYLYTFNRSLSCYTPSCIGSSHFTDVYFLFPEIARSGNPPLVPRGYNFTYEETWISNYMNALWTTFANSPSNPTSPIFSDLGVPGWKKFDSNSEYDLLIDFGNMTVLRSKYYAHVCELWDNPNKQLFFTLGIVLGIFSIVVLLVILVCIIPYIRHKVLESHQNEPIEYY